MTSTWIVPVNRCPSNVANDGHARLRGAGKQPLLHLRPVDQISGAVRVEHRLASTGSSSPQIQTLPAIRRKPNLSILNISIDQWTSMVGSSDLLSWLEEARPGLPFHKTTSRRPGQARSRCRTAGPRSTTTTSGASGTIPDSQEAGVMYLAFSSEDAARLQREDPVSNSRVMALDNADLPHSDRPRPAGSPRASRVADVYARIPRSPAVVRVPSCSSDIRLLTGHQATRHCMKSVCHGNNPPARRQVSWRVRRLGTADNL